MTRIHSATALLSGAACLLSLGSAFAQEDAPGWEATLAETIPLFGHRNWICIVDAAYPAQSAEGIITVATGEGQLEVVDAVLAALAETEHVKPTVYVDRELEFVPEEYAEGIGEYREALDDLLRDQEGVQRLPHEEIIAQLDEAAKTFQVLILKTDMTLPYTSVFLQLECGYWSAEAEAALREAMPGEE